MNCKALEPTDLIDKLTPRELEVLIHIANGESTRVIARELNISRFTVMTHRKRINKKTGVRNPADAAVLAVRSGVY